MKSISRYGTKLQGLMGNETNSLSRNLEAMGGSNDQIQRIACLLKQLEGGAKLIDHPWSTTCIFQTFAPQASSILVGKVFKIQ